MKRFAICALAVTLTVALAPAAAHAASDELGKDVAPEKVVYDAATAFEYFKSLEGEWTRAGATSEHGGSARSTTFRNSAAGSTVLGTLYPGEPNEMLNVFHMDGSDLLLTHYCALMNAPIMKFVPSDVPGEIRFEFNGGTNFDPAIDAHVHEGVFRVMDRDTVESAFVSHAGGKPGRGTSALLSRKAPQ
jgi:hypothetical protein